MDTWFDMGNMTIPNQGECPETVRGERKGVNHARGTTVMSIRGMFRSVGDSYQMERRIGSGYDTALLPFERLNRG